MKLSLKDILKKKEFHSAIDDVKYFYSRDYPEKTVIQAVGNRYRLNRQERMILYRGISKHTFNKALTIIQPEDIEGQDLLIDGFNVLITVESYLKGIIVFKAVDKFTRDIAGIHSYKSKPDLSDKAVKAVFESLHMLKPRNTTVIFDEPLSKSREIAGMFNAGFTVNKISGNAFTNESPDFLLKNSDQIVCSSDSVIISRAERVFDLPGFIIEKFFHNKILPLTCSL